MMETHSFIKHFSLSFYTYWEENKNVILPRLDWNYKAKEDLEFPILLSSTPEFIIQC